MHARSISLMCRPDAVEELVGFVRDEVLPTVTGMDGNRGLSMLADRDSGRCIVTTSWASPEAMAASGDYFRTARARMCDIAGDDSPGISQWEIALMHRMHETTEGSCARVVWARGTTSLDDGLATWRAMVLPVLEGMQGFCSVSVMVDRDAMRAVSSSVYDSREAMRGNAEAAGASRDRFRAATGMTIDDMAEFDVVLAHLRVPEMA